jgi:hypothetical protein
MAIRLNDNIAVVNELQDLVVDCLHSIALIVKDGGLDG